MQKPIAVAVTTIAAEPAAARFPKGAGQTMFALLIFHEALSTNPYSSHS